LQDGGALVPLDDAQGRHVYNQFTLRVPRRDALQIFLKEREIATMIYYPVSLHQQEVYRDLGYGDGTLPRSELAAREVISVPVHPELAPEQVSFVADAIRSFVGKR
jgi:dTDP-4-amino-4,6-dideoxygalactose transaminase